MDNLRKLKEALETIYNECRERKTGEDCIKCKYSNNGFCIFEDMYINSPYNWELDEAERFLSKKEA